MSTNLACVSYEFIFNPAETWSHASQFDSELAKFFEDRNLEARVIVSHGDKIRRFMITAKPMIEIPKEKETKSVVNQKPFDLTKLINSYKEPLTKSPVYKKLENPNKDSGRPVTKFGLRSVTRNEDSSSLFNKLNRRG